MTKRRTGDGPTSPDSCQEEDQQGAKNAGGAGWDSQKLAIVEQFLHREVRLLHQDGHG